LGNGVACRPLAEIDGNIFERYFENKIKEKKGVHINKYY